MIKVSALTQRQFEDHANGLLAEYAETIGNPVDVPVPDGERARHRERQGAGDAKSVWNGLTFRRGQQGALTIRPSGAKRSKKFPSAVVSLEWITLTNDVSTSLGRLLGSASAANPRSHVGGDHAATRRGDALVVVRAREARFVTRPSGHKRRGACRLRVRHSHPVNLGLLQQRHDQISGGGQVHG